MAEVAAVLLAAGASTRFGTENKLVAEINGRPLVRATADAVLGAGIAEVVVVTGSEPGLVERALDGLSIMRAGRMAWGRRSRQESQRFATRSTPPSSYRATCPC
jgi:molybdenum cofactor cytidylyltransferase